MLPRIALAKASSSLAAGRVVSRQSVLAARNAGSLRVSPLATARQPVLKRQGAQLSPSTSIRGYAAAAVRTREDSEAFVPTFDLNAPAPSRPRTSNHPAQSVSYGDVSKPAFTAAEESPEHKSDSDVSGDDYTFQSLRNKIDHKLLRALTIEPFKFKKMSEVQKRVLGLMPGLSGKQLEKFHEGPEQREREDLLVKARTGTGKTIAFLVPAVEARLQAMRQREGSALSKSVGALIISPTRELATQIAEEAKKLTFHHRQLETRLLVGGASKGQQMRQWKFGCDIVVATPGRLKDLLENEPKFATAFEKTDTLIMDEADTLLDMGFTKDLTAIIDFLPKERQTFLFSATVSPEIRDIARKSLKRNHVFIDCVPKDESNTHQHIPQFATVLPSAAQQLPHILRLIAHDQLSKKDSKIIVFLPTTKMTMLFATLLRELGDSLPERTVIHEIHSKLEQSRRSRTSDRFRSDRRPSILVTSDVSARGVDYPGVTRVIQVGVPTSSEQYIHRVGRTGRAGATGGRGDIVLLPWEKQFLSQLNKVPIENQSSEDLTNEVMDLAAGHHHSLGKLESLDAKVSGLMPSLDPDAIDEVFGSLVGYYNGRANELGLSGWEAYENLQTWSVEAAGLAEPASLSMSFLQKLGIRPGVKRSSGGFGGGRDRGRSSFGFRDRGGRPEPRSSGFGRRDDRSSGFRGQRGNDQPWERRGRSRREDWA